MRKVLLGGAVWAVALLAATAWAGAGLAPQMVATPNPVTVGSSFTVSNVAGAANTCEDGGEVHLAIVDTATDDEVDADVVTPDGDGNWSITGTATEVGSYVIEGRCLGEEPDSAPQATPDFTYASVPFQVVPVPTTTTSTTTPEEPVESTTTTEPEPAAAAVATPAFTG